MPKLSAGLLVHRTNVSGQLELLIVHPGGPFWAKKDEGAWSIPKGEYDEGDDPFATALREFEEELGSPPPDSPCTDLGEIRQPSGKRLHCWSAEGNLNVQSIVSNHFEMEWPRGSGQMKSFPEVDRAGWFTVAAARQKLLKGHVGFVDRLITHLRETGVDVNEGDEGEPQATLF